MSTQSAPDVQPSPVGKVYPPGALCTIYRSGVGDGLLRMFTEVNTPHGSPAPLTAEGSDPAFQRNSIIRKARTLGLKWLCFTDSDQDAFDADRPWLVKRMLDHDEPVISAVVLQRGAPFKTNAFRKVHRTETGPWTGEHLEAADLPEEGLVKVDAVGAGFLFVRSEVWEAMPEPWFEVGLFSHECQCEDLAFTWKATQLGFGVYVDAGLSILHEVRGWLYMGRRDRRPWIKLPGVPHAVHVPLLPRAEDGRL